MSKFIISSHSIDKSILHKEESNFSLANGKIGIRGVLEEDFVEGMGYDNNTYMYGFFEKSPIIYGESAYGYAKNHQTIAPVPSGHGFSVTVDGEVASIRHGKVIVNQRDFNMKEGNLKREFIWESSTGKQVKIESIRQIIQASNAPVDVVYSFRVTPINFSGEIEIHSFYGVIAPTEVVELENDPRKKHTFKESVSYDYYIENNRIVFDVQAGHSNRRMQAVFEETINQPVKVEYVKGNSSVVCKYRIDVINQQTYEIQGIGCYSLDPIKELNYDLDFILTKHQETMEEFWKKSLIEVEGDDDLAIAIIFNLYHLYQSAGRRPNVNVAAKGLSGAGYEGHYFWDTEMYMIHQFIYTQPEIAKNLLLYRYSILSQARNRANEIGIRKGVLFPWRTIDGKEASAYYPAGTAQVHINADIAYAVYEYYRVTQDKQFMLDVGLEILVETARFWVEFGDDLGDCFVINGVTGPDEYTALVNNNYYTNKMAQANLLYAAELSRKFSYHIESDEIKNWLDIAKKIKLGYCDVRKITKQDDAIFERAIWDFDNTPKSKYPLLLHYHPMMIYRYQVNKQADTVLAHYLFFDESNVEQIARDYEYYESITTHDSSLSKSIFSIVASLLGDSDKAYRYFMETVYTDLYDSQGNVIDGIHAANMGGMWLSLIRGFAGFRYIGNTPSINNHLPNQWNKLKFTLRMGLSVIEITLTHENTEVSLVEGPPLEILVDGKWIYLEDD